MKKVIKYGKSFAFRLGEVGKTEKTVGQTLADLEFSQQNNFILGEEREREINS